MKILSIQKEGRTVETEILRFWLLMPAHHKAEPPDLKGACDKAGATTKKKSSHSLGPASVRRKSSTTL